MTAISLFCGRIGLATVLLALRVAFFAPPRLGLGARATRPQRLNAASMAAFGRKERVVA
jgi:hypothetical protein